MIGTAAGVLAASLVGSVHCASMCGGFVCFYTGSGNGAGGGAELPGIDRRGTHGQQSTMLHAHALYNVGRLISYLGLGAAAGLIGSHVTSLGLLVGIQQTAAVLAGLLMVLWALSTLAAQRGLSIVSVRAPVVWQRALGTIIHAIRNRPARTRAFVTGLLTTLLPCGWLYVFVATAGGSGSVLSAMGIMVVFWIGTVPALVAVGLGAQSLFGRYRNRLPAVSATVVLIMGLWSIGSHVAPSLRLLNNASVPIGTEHAH